MGNLIIKPETEYYKLKQIRDRLYQINFEIDVMESLSRSILNENDNIDHCSILAECLQLLEELTELSYDMYLQYLKVYN